MIGQKGVPNHSGGIETHVSELSTRLVRAGHKVTAYARPWYQSDASKRFNGIDIVILPTIRTKHLDAAVHTVIASLHACFISRPDIIHYHGVGPALFSFIPRILRPSARVVTTFHCIDAQHEKWNGFARLALRMGEKACITFGHATIAVSKSLKNYIALRYSKHVNYIPNGITPRRTSINDVILEPLGLRSGNYIIMVSRLVKHKGAHTLIDAWQLAFKKDPNALKNMKLAIVGGSAFTDAYIAGLHQQAAGDESIVFTGYQRGETLNALFAGSRFMVHPSVSEGLPIAILEGMSYGKAVIATDISENKEIIDQHGMSVKAGDIDEIADRILELASDPMHAASIGHAARTFVELEYNWDDIAMRTIDIYDEFRTVKHAKLVLE